MPPASDNKKGKVRAEEEDREGDSDGDDDAPETAPLLRPTSSTAAGDVRGAGATAAPASRPASAILRHGRGLLSEDEGGSQRRRSTAFAGADSQGPANGDDTDDDEDDDADDEGGAGLLGWRRRRSSASSRRRRGRPSWKGVVCYVFLALLAVAFIAFAIIHLWIGRFVSEQMADNASRIRARAQDALVYRGPDSMKVLSMDSNTTTVQVQMRMGIDVRTVFGWNETHLPEVEANEGAPRKQQPRLPLSRRLERKIIGWATRRIGVTTMDLPEPILVSPLSDKNCTMLQLALLHPVSLPLYFPKADRYNVSDLSWLRNITLTVPIEVLDPELMADFVNRTMESNEARVHVRVQKAHVTLGREGDRSWLTRQVQRNGAQTIEGIELDQVVDGESQAPLISQVLAAKC